MVDGVADKPRKHRFRYGTQRKRAIKRARDADWAPAWKMGRFNRATDAILHAPKVGRQKRITREGRLVLLEGIEKLVHRILTGARESRLLYAGVSSVLGRHVIYSAWQNVAHIPDKHMRSLASTVGLSIEAPQGPLGAPELPVGGEA